jgi:23S rRNA pseudouridine2605 synthase
MSPERLQKVLAAAGVASRRGAETLIQAGRVTVDGRPAVLGEQVDPATARIAVDGVPLAAPAAHVHLVLHKPAGVTSTVRDRHAERTVIDLLPDQLRGRGMRIYPVGRLDKDSEGLLLLTNDGSWADRVLHPRHEVEREYAIAVRASLDERQARVLLDGIDLDEGLATLEHLRPMTAPELHRLDGLLRPRPAPGLTWYRATLRQGWKRQLRRMFGAVGAPVARLVRVRIGPVRLDDLASGEARLLTAAEVRALGAAGSPSAREG